MKEKQEEQATMPGHFIHFLLPTAHPGAPEARNTIVTGWVGRLVPDVYFPLNASHLINTGAAVSLKPSLLPLAWGVGGKPFLQGQYR